MHHHTARLAALCPVFGWQDPGRVADYPSTGRYIFGDYGARADDRLPPYGDAGQQDGTAPNPDLVFNGDRQRRLRSLNPFVGLQRMGCGIDLHVWPNHHMGADANGGIVQQGRSPY